MDRNERLDRLEAATERMAIGLDRLVGVVETLATNMAGLMARMDETREDIDRLYAAWPEHLRRGHTP